MSSSSHFRGVLRGAGLLAKHLGREALPELRKGALGANERPTVHALRDIGESLVARASAVHAVNASPAAPASEPPRPGRAQPAVAAEASLGNASRHGETDGAPPSSAATTAAATSQPPSLSPPNALDDKARAAAVSTSNAAEEASDSTLTTHADIAEPPPDLVSEAVPSSSISRAFHFGMLGASVVWSGSGNLARRRLGSLFGGGGGDGDESVKSAYVNEESAERMAKTLSKLRGAALKLGQMLSLQDDHAVPPQLQAVFNKIRASAHVMPQAQLHSTLRSELGEDWRDRVRSFGEQPVASASIGQVHRAVLPDGRLVALKVQYPGVAASIDSDLANLRRLANYTGMLPRTLFVDNIIRVAKEELLAECDYAQEAAHTDRYRALVTEAEAANPALRGAFRVPAVIPELSSARVLATEWLAGGPVEAVERMGAGRRNAVASRVLSLTLLELFQWRFMQTDPNWGNYLYDAPSDTISLIDFGAAREYAKPFVDDYLRMVDACARRDRNAIMDTSLRLGFLTGDEPGEMHDAHVAAGFILGEPFATREPFDFAASQLSTRVRQHVPVMLKYRQRPPPNEIYSLHRKLSGFFMLCIRLRATIDCRQAFDAIRDDYQLDPVPVTPPAASGATDLTHGSAPHDSLGGGRPHETTLATGGAGSAGAR